MGLTYQSTGLESLTEIYKIDKNKNQYVIALAGNPNTGKSTVFNTLTGLKQHTGNWPGKTVTNARGEFSVEDKEYILVDLPGTYSLFASSVEEEIARDFICFSNADVVVVVTDATCLERNMNLVYQVMELTEQVILCINLIDEAKKKNIYIDAKGIETELGIPVVLTAARSGIGIEDLKKAVYKVTTGEIKCSPKKIAYQEYIEQAISEIQPLVENHLEISNPRWVSLRLVDGDKNFLETILGKLESSDSGKLVSITDKVRKENNRMKIRDDISSSIYHHAEIIKERYIRSEKKKFDRDKIIDDYITSKTFGIPIMLLVLSLVFWITITGANIPSQIIANFLFGLEAQMTQWFMRVNAPIWLHGVLILGLYRTLAWVVSVMLPPMAIFFPLFTLLEDLGYLPRVAFNLDHLFKKACCHGKQCLTMCMGLGCNAAGIIGCRIIDSPRERLVAMLTNNFVPCNGRFPTLIAIASVFFVASNNNRFLSMYPALVVTSMVILGVMVSLLISYLLSKTLLKGIPSSFTLELPPYRKPQIGRVIYTSIIDRTIFVLFRAVVVAAPAGAITWLLGNIYIGDLSVISYAAGFLDPIAKFIGLDGFILMAFILGLPANEIVLPILLMAYLSTGSMIEFESIDALRQILLSHGWTYLTALNVMLFSLLHWPCATTLLTIKKETGSLKWTLMAAAIPTLVAFIVCAMTTLIFKMFGLA
jgi:ferrous iron transport protein B